MATNQPLPDGGPPRVADAAAAQPLAASLRRTRLTLLCGQAGAGKSDLLAGGLLPLLRRRGGDAAFSVTRRQRRNVLPFPERRALGDHPATAELVIFVDDWLAPSPAGLHDGIDAALRAAGVDPEWYREPLADRVQSLASRFGVRFLFVLDGFEAVLRQLDDGAARADLLDDLVRLLNEPAPANLLIALRDDAELLLAPLLDRLHTVRAAVLMLEGGRTRRVYGAATPAPDMATPPAAAKPAPTELWQFDSAGMPEAANTGVPTRPGELEPGPAGHTDRVGPVPPFRAPPPAPQRRRLTKRRRMALVSVASVALLALAGGAVLWRLALTSGNYAPLEAATPAETTAATVPAAPAAALATSPAPTRPLSMAPPATPPTPAIAALPPRPSFALQVDTESAGTRLPRELARALAADGIADVRVVPTPLAFPERTIGSPGLAVVRYDALQAAARAGTKPDLAVVAPLYTDEIQIVVRADSPLRFIHEIEGARINVGAPRGARAVTARAMYRLMFGRPLPAAKQGRLDAAAALQRLAAGDGLDAVVLVGPQPSAALAALPPAQQRGLRLLGLAPDDPSSRRALQSYLPATLRDPAGTAGTPTLAAMSFLVTTGRPDAETAEMLGRLATSLCRQLPALQRDGDAKWRTLKAGLQLDTGWPAAGAADAAWRACGGVGPSGSTPTAATAPTVSTTR